MIMVGFAAAVLYQWVPSRHGKFHVAAENLTADKAYNAGISRSNTVIIEALLSMYTSCICARPYPYPASPRSETHWHSACWLAWPGHAAVSKRGRVAACVGGLIAYPSKQLRA